MKQATTVLTIPTPGKGLVEFTRTLQDWIRASGVREGLVTLLCRHTSAGLTIQENADPRVQGDLVRAFDALAPEDRAYAHCNEGADDMPAHIKSVLGGVSLAIPVIDGRAALGTWQGVYIFEHRAQPHQRQVAVHVMGE